VGTQGTAKRKGFRDGLSDGKYNEKEGAQWQFHGRVAKVDDDYLTWLLHSRVEKCLKKVLQGYPGRRNERIQSCLENEKVENEKVSW
jgi:hypothetical protein